MREADKLIYDFYQIADLRLGQLRVRSKRLALPAHLLVHQGGEQDHRNKLDIAFHVDSVLGIHTVSWTEIIKPEVTISTAEEGVAIGIVKYPPRSGWEPCSCAALPGH